MLATLSGLRIFWAIPYQEAHSVWKITYLSNPALNLQAFEELFGSLFNDTEKHFKDFLVAKNYSTCVAIEIFSILAMLCPADSVLARLTFVLSLFVDRNEQISTEHLQQVFNKVLVGFHRLFDIIMSTKEEVDSFVRGSLFSFKIRNSPTEYNSHTDNNKDSDNGAELDDETRLMNSLMNTGSAVAIKVSEFWQWSQDTREISDFLEAVKVVCESFRRQKNEKKTAAVKVNVMLDQETDDDGDDDDDNASGDHEERSNSTRVANTPVIVVPYENRKGSIVKGAFDSQKGRRASALAVSAKLALPPVVLDCSLLRTRHPLWKFRIIDLVDDSWFHELPIVSTEDKVFSALEQLVLSSRLVLPVFLRTSTVASSVTHHHYSQQQQQQLQHLLVPAKNTDFNGYLDYMTIIAWIAEACPEMVTAQTRKEKELADLAAKLGTTKRQSMALFNKNTGGGIGSMEVRTTIAMMYQGSAREKNTSHHDLWQNVGITVALSPLKSAMDSRFLAKRPKLPTLSSQLCDIILQTDQFIFSVIEIFAQGYRSIPIAASSLKPYAVTHLLTSFDVVKFFRYYGREILGRGISTLVEGIRKYFLNN